MNSPGHARSEQSNVSPMKVAFRLLLGTAVIIVILGLLFVGPITRARQAALRSKCTCHGKQLGLALCSYHETYKSFPPAYLADADGKPMHSWRVLILPFMEATELYQQYDFNEPWNGPHNARLADKMPDGYRCPSADPTSNEASYLAVMGPKTGWPNEKALTQEELPDGTPNTIALVECANSGINWLEPRDLTFEQAAKGVNPAGVKPSISSAHRGGANVLFFDSSVHFLSDNLSTEVLRGLLTANGGEDVTTVFD